MVQGATRIQIPPRFNEILGDSALGNSLRLYVQRFDAWVGDDTKGLFFFPEYTDHGPRHITSVLFGAEALIREEAWKAVTREDVVVFVAATLFHDAAMHLAADGFLSLIDPARAGARPLVRLLDDKTWPELFAAYYSEARKWDQRRLHRILGDEAVPQEEEPDLMDSVRRPEEMPNPETWTVRHRKFLGEFVRRHHARLAHEIALHGYPGRSLDTLRLPDELASLADLAGLVARSHNVHLRDTFEYLQQKHYGRLHPQNAHPVFLMVLLRIADYLEIRSDRVNPAALAIQRLRSPISVEEQSSHLAVHEVRPDEHDEEAIFVIARPPSARLFLKLQSLLRGLQAELDTSWAVLGEVYSKQSDLSCFGIRLRRVRSNLDVPAEYLRREEPSYLPVRAAFDTTGADLLKLLIKPLYGDQPEIGIRELLQNALDAVHELRQWAADHGDPTMERIPLSDQEADVLISIDKDEHGEAWLKVQDKGIGMTVEVVQGYFLKAGASYRESTAWRQDFENEIGVKVLRSGRFGIGVLAAFLLGDRIEVSTRHISQGVEGGIYFAASIADEIVELQRRPMHLVGTVVMVKLNSSAKEALLGDWQQKERFWDFYVLDDPLVERRVLGEQLEQSVRIPLPRDGATVGWNELQGVGYESMMWGFQEVPLQLVCNGIIVTRRRLKATGEESWGRRGIPFGVPTISIFDREGRLPLNLQRNAVVSQWPPFEAELIRDLTWELCAFQLVHAPHNPLDFAEFGLAFNSWTRAKFLNGFGSSSEYLMPFLFTPDGTTLFSSWHLRELGIRRFVCVAAGRIGDLNGLQSTLTTIGGAKGMFLGRKSWKSMLRDLAQNLDFSLNSASIRVLTKLALPQNSFEETQVRNDRWRIARYCPGKAARSFPADEWEKSELEAIYELLPGERRSDFLMFIEVVVHGGFNVRESPFTRAVEEILDSALVPYNLEERLRVLPRAFAHLESYIERWQPENLVGWRLDLVQSLPGRLLPHQ